MLVHPDALLEQRVGVVFLIWLGYYRLPLAGYPLRLEVHSPDTAPIQVKYQRLMNELEMTFIIWI